MSNRANLVSTKFTNVKQGNETFGFRMYDDEGQAYDNTWDFIPENDLDVLAKVIDESSDRTVEAILDSIQENENGIYIGDTWYDWDEIKHLFE